MGRNCQIDVNFSLLGLNNKFMSINYGFYSILFLLLVQA